MQTVYVVHPNDNVATALSDVEKGTASTIGAVIGERVPLSQPVKAGHKVAIKQIRNGEPVVKYGATIGMAKTDIATGGWVHVHTMQSCFDERSAHIDPESGSAFDTKYE